MNRTMPILSAVFAGIHAVHLTSVDERTFGVFVDLAVKQLEKEAEDKKDLGQGDLNLAQVSELGEWALAQTTPASTTTTSTTAKPEELPTGNKKTPTKEDKAKLIAPIEDDSEMMDRIKYVESLFQELSDFEDYLEWFEAGTDEWQMLVDNYVPFYTEELNWGMDAIVEGYNQKLATSEQIWQILSEKDFQTVMDLFKKLGGTEAEMKSDFETMGTAVDQVDYLEYMLGYSIDGDEYYGAGGEYVPYDDFETLYTDEDMWLITDENTWDWEDEADLAYDSMWDSWCDEDDDDCDWYGAEHDDDWCAMYGDEWCDEDADMYGEEEEYDYWADFYSAVPDADVEPTTDMYAGVDTTTDMYADVEPTTFAQTTTTATGSSSSSSDALTTELSSVNNKMLALGPQFPKQPSSTSKTGKTTSSSSTSKSKSSSSSTPSSSSGSSFSWY